MMMTDNEIRMSYKYAANRTGQIRILAQLNACGTNDIRDILGLPHTDEKQYRGASSNPYHNWTDKDDDIIKSMCRGGYSDAVIAETLGVKPAALRHRRKKIYGAKDKTIHQKKWRGLYA